MKNRTFLAACVGAVILGAVFGFMPADQNMTKANGQTVVNTTQISRKVRGLNGPTPVKIYIHKDKIAKIETLSNHETPDFFNRAKADSERGAGAEILQCAQIISIEAITQIVDSYHFILYQVPKSFDSLRHFFHSQFWMCALRDT